ncbi:hypothetical protein AN958_00439 [Leucoagaricus sp. SymC.cos]|nr:hypothetical protein AN958_00439 [Leucoagaricus sp. SymC.cos]
MQSALSLDDPDPGITSGPLQGEGEQGKGLVADDQRTTTDLSNSLLLSNSSKSAQEDLFPVSPGSTTPTTASPESSDQEEEVKLVSHSIFPPQPQKAPVCAQFKKKGSCPMGGKCPFQHVQAQAERPTKSPSPQRKRIRGGGSVPVLSSSKSSSPKSSSPQPETTPMVGTPKTQSSPSLPQKEDSCSATPAVVGTQLPLAKSSPPQDTSRAATPMSTEKSEQLAKPSLPQPKPVAGASVATSSSPSSTLKGHGTVLSQTPPGIPTAFESSTLLVSNISTRLRPKDLKETLSSYGIVEDLRMPASFSAGYVVRVVYSDAAEAQKAQNALNGTKMYDKTITAKVANSGSKTQPSNVFLRDTTVRISWEAPAKEVFAGYVGKEQAQRAIQITRDAPLNGHYLRGEIYEGMPAVGNVNVKFRGVPVDVDKADLVRFVNPVDIMWTRPNYTNLEDATRFVQRKLREFGLGPENIEILPPPYRDGGMVRAWATFPSAAKAKEAARCLDSRKPKCTGFSPIRATHVQSLAYTVKPDKWPMLGPAIESLQASQRGKLASITIVSRENGQHLVRLAGDDQKELAHLKNRFEGIFRGEVVRCDGKVVYDSYFTRKEGWEFLRDLSIKNPNVHFENDTQRLCIRLYGYIVDRVRFANAIVTKVKEFRSLKKFEIPLPGRLFGAAMVDRALKELRLSHGLDNVRIDLWRRVLVVRGDFGLFQKFKNVVDQIEQRLPKVTAYTGPTCPICLDKPTLPIRLQCAHIWCRGCISQYFQSAKEQRTFPLKCLGKEGKCGTKIPISVAKQVLSGSELEALANAAFLAHVTAHPKEFHFCPTPDCPQVYRSTPQKATLQCPSCLTSICTRCHTEAHDEFQCSDQVQDELFKKWMKEHDVKDCPTCDAPIEKIEGCNHMTCTRCQTHICWQCMKTFPGGEGIYGHMREVHGTFGLGQVFD